MNGGVTMTFNLGRDVNFTDASGVKKKLAEELAKIGTGGGGTTNLNDLSDVDTTTTPPSEGNVLKYVGGTWKPGIDTTAEGGGSVVTDSTTNGNILVDGAEVQVYNDSTINNKIGDLSALQTTAKSNVVEAINEVKGSTGGATSVRTEENQEYIYSFDVNNISVYQRPTMLTIPVQSYNAGSTAVVHPSVLYFTNKWNGYHYWMGINPYAGTNFENPAIFCSNDGFNWLPPAGLTNPIDGMPTTGYGSDINIFMSKDNKTMYAINRHYHDTFRKIYIYSSTNGVTWTGVGAANRVTILESSNASTDWMSPCVILDGGVYKMFAVDLPKQINSSVYNQIDVYTASNPLGTWVKGTPITLTSLKSDERIWHLEVRKIGSFYYLLYQTCHQTVSGTEGRLYLAKSTDLTTWEVSPTSFSSVFDTWGKTSYKSSFLPVIDGEGMKIKVWHNVTGGASNWDLNYAELRNVSRDNVERVPNAKLLFHDNFTRAEGATIKDATLGKWTVGASNTGTTPGIVIGNGLATTSGATGIDRVLTIVDNSDYNVRLTIGELQFYHNATQTGGNGFIVNASKDFASGFCVFYQNSRLTFAPRKASISVQKFYINRTIQPDDILIFEVRNTEKRIFVYLNGVLVLNYDDSVNQMMSEGSTYIGFMGDPAKPTFSLKEIRVYAPNYKPVPDRAIESLTRLMVGKDIKGDNFKKVDGAVGNLLDGTAWTSVSGTWAIAGNKLKQTGAVAALLTFDSLWRDHYLEINTGNMGGLVTRYVDASNYVLFEYDEFSTFRLAKVVGGTRTNIVTDTYTGFNSALPYGSNKILGFKAVGNDFVGYLNGREILKATIADAVFNTSTSVGVYAKYSENNINYFLASKL
jgi:hypothetical protein